MAYGIWLIAYGICPMMGPYFSVRLNALILLLKDSPFLFISSRSS
jgi:hypothetical protein